MPSPNEHVMDLIFGRWRSQTLYAGVELGVFDVIDAEPKPASEITDELDVDRGIWLSTAPVPRGIRVVGGGARPVVLAGGRR